MMEQNITMCIWTMHIHNGDIADTLHYIVYIYIYIYIYIITISVSNNIIDTNYLYVYYCYLYHYLYHKVKLIALLCFSKSLHFV